MSVMFTFCFKLQKKKAKKDGGQGKLTMSEEQVAHIVVRHGQIRFVYSIFLGKKKKEFNPDAPKLDRVPFPDL